MRKQHFRRHKSGAALKRLKRTQATTAGVSTAFEPPPLVMPVKDFKHFLSEGSLEISIGMSIDFRMSPYKECCSKHSVGFPLLKAACLHDVWEFTVLRINLGLSLLLLSTRLKENDCP